MKKIGLKDAWSLAQIVILIIAAYLLFTGFQRTIVSQISEWMGFFFFLYTASIIAVCWRHHSGDRKNYYEILFLLGFTGFLIAMTAVDVLSDSHTGLIVLMVVFTAAVILVTSLSAISATNDSPAAVIDGTVAMLAMFMALALISITAVNFRYTEKGEYMVWLCCAYLVATEVLVFFLFEIMLRMEKLADKNQAKSVG